MAETTWGWCSCQVTVLTGCETWDTSTENFGNWRHGLCLWQTYPPWQTPYMVAISGITDRGCACAIQNWTAKACIEPETCKFKAWEGDGSSPCRDNPEWCVIDGVYYGARDLRMVTFEAIHDPANGYRIEAVLWQFSRYSQIPYCAGEWREAARWVSPWQTRKFLPCSDFRLANPNRIRLTLTAHNAAYPQCDLSAAAIDIYHEETC